MLPDGSARTSAPDCFGRIQRRGPKCPDSRPRTLARPGLSSPRTRSRSTGDGQLFFLSEGRKMTVLFASQDHERAPWHKSPIACRQPQRLRRGSRTGRPLRRSDAAPVQDTTRATQREVISGLNGTAWALAVYASPGGLPHRTQDSLLAAGQALPGGIGYPQDPDERFPRCIRYISSSSPKLLGAGPVPLSGSTATAGRDAARRVNSAEVGEVRP
jgi:hypothetical protein